MKKSNRFLNIYLYSSIFLIVAPLLIVFLWAFASRWPWPNLLPETFSLRPMKEIWAPYNNLFPIILSSIGLSLTVAIGSTIVATMTARALSFYDFFGKRIIEIASLAPNLVPVTVFAMGVHIILIKLSLANTFTGVIFVHLIYSLPYSVSIMRDLTDSIGNELEEQATLLGASPWRAFYHISLPLLGPGLMASINMSFIISFSQYFTTLLIGGGKVKTLSILMVPFISKGDRPIGSALALVFIFTILFVFLLVNWINRLLLGKSRGKEI